MSIFRALLASAILSTAATAPSAHAQMPAAPLIAQQTHLQTSAGFESLLRVAPRSVSAESSERALREMGFERSGEGPFSWASKSGGNGSYLIKDLIFVASNEGQLTVDQLSVEGLRMEGGAPVFDRLDLSGVGMNTSDVNLKTGRMSISHPDPSFATALINMFKHMEDDNVFETFFEDVDIDYMANVFIRDTHVELDEDGSKSTMSLDQIGWAVDKASNTGRMRLRNFNANITESPNEPPLDVTLAQIDTHGVDLDYMKTVFLTLKASGLSSTKLADLVYQNPYNKNYDDFSASGLNVKSDGINVSLESFTSRSQKVGDVLTVTSQMQPFSLSFYQEPEDKELAQFRAILQDNGLERFAVTTGSTTRLVESTDSFETSNAYFNLENLARFDFSYSGTGLKAMMDISNGMDSDTEKLENNTKSDDDLMTLLADMSLKHMDISMTDIALVDMLLKYAAEDQGTSPDLLKIQAKAGLMMAPMMAKNEAQAALAMDLAKAMQGLLDQGGTLDIKMRPDVPVTVSTFKNFEMDTFDPAALGLTVTHRK